MSLFNMKNVKEEEEKKIEAKRLENPATYKQIRRVRDISYIMTGSTGDNFKGQNITKMSQKFAGYLISQYKKEIQNTTEEEIILRAKELSLEYNYREEEPKKANYILSNINNLLNHYTTSENIQKDELIKRLQILKNRATIILNKQTKTSKQASKKKQASK